jgi:hypothetical protein
MGASSVFTRDLHRPDISEMRARISYIVILFYLFCNISFSFSREFHIHRRTFYFNIFQIFSIGLKSDD